MLNIDLLKKAQEAAPVVASAYEAIAAAPSAPSVPVVDKKADAYFEKDGYISRSELLAMQKERKGGKAAPPPDFVFRSGKQFDCFFTEPHLWKSNYADDATEFELLQILKAKKALFEAQALPYTEEALTNAIENEEALLDDAVEFQSVVRTMVETPSGIIKVKAKADWIVGNECIFDYKSTTKQTLQDFEKDITKHKLDLQAAWYCDAFGINSFKLVVCSYAKSHHISKALFGVEASYRAIDDPSKVWVIDMAPYIDQGREKYQRLVAEAVEAGQIVPAIPSKKRRSK